MEKSQGSVFDHILNNDEKVIWAEKPAKAPYLWVTIPPGITFFIIGLIVLPFSYNFADGWFTFGESNTSMPWYGYLFVAASCFPIWLGFIYPFYKMMDYKNVYYCYTNKRIIFREGAWGADYKALEYDKISDIQVNVGPVGKKYNTGNIIVVTGVDAKGRNISNTMYAISQPYEVFKNIKKVIQDIKTDFYYPNDLRPEVNKGYKTEYKPE